MNEMRKLINLCESAMSSDLSGRTTSGQVPRQPYWWEDGPNVIDAVGEDYVDDIAEYIFQDRTIDKIYYDRAMANLSTYYKDQIPHGLSGEKLEKFLLDKVFADYGSQLEDIFRERQKHNREEWIDADPDQVAQWDAESYG